MYIFSTQEERITLSPLTEEEEEKMFALGKIYANHDRPFKYYILEYNTPFYEAVVETMNNGVCYKETFYAS